LLGASSHPQSRCELEFRRRASCKKPNSQSLTKPSTLDPIIPGQFRAVLCCRVDRDFKLWCGNVCLGPRLPLFRLPRGLPIWFHSIMSAHARRLPTMDTKTCPSDSNVCASRANSVIGCGKLGGILKEKNKLGNDWMPHRFHCPPKLQH
jgi:hypothetical protein